MKKKAVVLMSGGLDSITCLAIAQDQGFECYTLSFNYGQRHVAELEAGKRIAKKYHVAAHKIITLGIGELKGSATTDETQIIPDYSGDHRIPVTYVPARNTVFLSIALGWAEILEAYVVFTGVSAVDYSGYPDCRPEYIAAFQQMANLATKTGVEGHPIIIHTPLLHLSKSATIQAGLRLGVDYADTVSCYRADSQGRACGRCDSCTLRSKGFQEAGVPDPTRYIDKDIPRS